MSRVALLWRLMQEWLDEMAKFLKMSWGLSGTFAAQVALLYGYFWFYGLSPKITSGFRDPVHQKNLIKQWDSGNRTGLAVRPATDSLHIRIDGNGSPSSQAVDIDTSDHIQAARIARYLGIGAGIDFSTPDPVHFYDKKGGNGL